MDTNNASELYKTANHIIAAMTPLYLSKDDKDDLRQEIVVAILSAVDKVDQSKNPDLYLFVVGWFGARKFLAKNIWNQPNTVDYFSYEDAGTPDPCITSVDTAKVVDILSSIDPYSWVAKYFGIGTDPMSVIDIAAMEGVSRQNVQQHINRQLAKIRSHIGGD